MNGITIKETINGLKWILHVFNLPFNKNSCNNIINNTKGSARLAKDELQPI